MWSTYSYDIRNKLTNKIHIKSFNHCYSNSHESFHKKGYKQIYKKIQNKRKIVVDLYNKYRRLFNDKMKQNPKRSLMNHKIKV